MKIFEWIKDARNFPEGQKRNPLYLINYKNEYGTLNPNSPSDLEWWYEDEPSKMDIINNHAFELLLILESENVTLKDAADKLIEYYSRNT
ncbi:hypothetical protein D3C73_185280 [compost metagenome]